jgi:hypothetical protein
MPAKTNKELMKIFRILPDPTWSDWIDPISQNYLIETGTIQRVDDLVQENILNPIFKEILNKCGRQIINSVKMFNPIEKAVKKDTMYNGGVVEEIQTQFVLGEAFPIDPEERGNLNPFERKKSEVLTEFAIQNRATQYRLTFDNIDICKAFESDTGIDNLFTAQMSGFKKSAEVDDYIFQKKCFELYYTNQKFPLIPTQIYSIPDYLSVPTFESIYNFSYSLKNLLLNISVVNKNYNSRGIVTAVDTNDLVLILNIPEFNAYNTIPATTYHNELLNLGIEICFVDGLFESESSDIFGCICDKEFLVEYDMNANKLSQQRNERGLYTNYFVTIQKSYFTRAFKTIVYLKKSPLTVTQTIEKSLTSINENLTNGDTKVEIVP